MVKDLKVYSILTEEFMDYGSFFELPEFEKTDGSSGFSWWREVIPNDFEQGVSFGMVEAYLLDEKIVTFLERHKLTREILVFIDGDVVINVAKADNSAAKPDFETIRSFKVNAGTIVILKEGVWHSAPMAVNKNVRALVVFKKDTDQVDFEDVQLMKEIGTEYKLVL